MHLHTILIALGCVISSSSERSCGPKNYKNYMNAWFCAETKFEGHAICNELCLSLFAVCVSKRRALQASLQVAQFVGLDIDLM